MCRHRGVLSDVKANAELPLSEDAVIVRLLICGIYDANHPVSWDTLEYTLELARKYDVDDMQLNCQRFLQTEQLSVATLPRFITLACDFDMDAALEQCQDYIAAPGNFEQIAE